MRRSDCTAPAPRRRALVALALAAGLGVACADIPEEPAGGAERVERAEAAARDARTEPGADHDDAECRGLQDERPVLLSWEGLAGGAPLRGRAPVLTLTSRAAEPIVARLSARFLTDQGAARVDLGEVSLREGGAARVAVPLDPPGVALSRLEFAAQVLVEAELWQGGRRLAGEGADALFFHPDPATGEVLAYGEAEARRSYGAGDFRRLRPRTAGEAAIAGVGRARPARPEDLVGDPEDVR